MGLLLPEEWLTKLKVFDFHKAKPEMLKKAVDSDFLVVCIT